MGRIWKILGAVLAVWVLFMAVGWIVAMLKTFILGLIAVAVVLVVSLLAGRRHRHPG